MSSLLQKISFVVCPFFFFSSTDCHVVEVECWGPGDIASGNAFHVKTVRKNPAKTGAVTGSATYASFFSSMLGKMQFFIGSKASFISGYKSFCQKVTCILFLVFTISHSVISGIRKSLYFRDLQN